MDASIRVVAFGWVVLSLAGVLRVGPIEVWLITGARYI